MKHSCFPKNLQEINDLVKVGDTYDFDLPKVRTMAVTDNFNLPKVKKIASLDLS